MKAFPLHLYPAEPGVYLMRSSQGDILYIGKAKNIRARLKQYFSEADTREMVPYLTAQVESIDTIVALSEKDALLLENNLIKRHQPKYNILLRDDKTFIGILMTQHRWPMLRLVRYKGTPTDQGSYFGPYTNAIAARQVCDLIMQIFPLRQCSDTEFAVRTRPCILHEIGRCLAPCVDKCNREEYYVHVQSAMRLLRGKDREVLQELKISMEEASSRLEFERAGAILQLIRQIEHVTTVQHVDHPAIGNCDAIGLYREGYGVIVALLKFREGKMVASEHFRFDVVASSDEELISSFILQLYRNNLVSEGLEILTPMLLPDHDALGEILATWGMSIAHPKRAPKSDLLEMAFRNAKALFLREMEGEALREQQLLVLQETLSLVRYPRHIDCFDTSHLGGSEAVAGLCSFIHGVYDKKHTRLFRLKGTRPSDDYGAVREVIYRHFTKLKQENHFCDLLILDGGKSHLRVALEVLRELDIASVDLIALSKEEGRHDKGLSSEKIHLPNRPDPILLEATSPLLFFLQRIRDEAHRIAIGFQKKRRSKSLQKSELDQISGIGPIKKKRLLKHFGSIKALAEASSEDWAQVSGITKKDLQQLARFFKSQS